VPDASSNKHLMACWVDVRTGELREGAPQAQGAHA
jgi:hypothetical protein